MTIFDKYGLDAIGVLNIGEANKLLIKVTLDVFKTQSVEAFTILTSCLNELVSKGTALTDRSYGKFAVYTICMGELTEQRNQLFTLLCNEFLPLTSMKCKLEDNTLIYCGDVV